eukprot:108843-Pyramimonas_sp.AAC.1
MHNRQPQSSNVAPDSPSRGSNKKEQAGARRSRRPSGRSCGTACNHVADETGGGGGRRSAQSG